MEGSAVANSSNLCASSLLVPLLSLSSAAESPSAGRFKEKKLATLSTALAVPSAASRVPPIP